VRLILDQVLADIVGELSVSDIKTVAIDINRSDVVQGACALPGYSPCRHSTGDSGQTAYWSIPDTDQDGALSDQFESGGSLDPPPPPPLPPIIARFAVPAEERHRTAGPRAGPCHYLGPATAYITGCTGNRTEAFTAAQPSESQIIGASGTGLSAGRSQASRPARSTGYTGDSESFGDGPAPPTESKTSLGTFSRFACPFFKRDPQKYRHTGLAQTPVGRQSIGSSTHRSSQLVALEVADSLEREHVFCRHALPNAH